MDVGDRVPVVLDLQRCDLEVGVVLHPDARAEDFLGGLVDGLALLGGQQRRQLADAGEQFGGGVAEQLASRFLVLLPIDLRLLCGVERGVELFPRAIGCLGEDFAGRGVDDVERASGRCCLAGNGHCLIGHGSMFT